MFQRCVTSKNLRFAAKSKLGIPKFSESKFYLPKISELNLGFPKNWETNLGFPKFSDCCKVTIILNLFMVNDKIIPFTCLSSCSSPPVGCRRVEEVASRRRSHLRSPRAAEEPATTSHLQRMHIVRMQRMQLDVKTVKLRKLYASFGAVV